MICPKCEIEYVDGIIICHDCNTALVTVENFEGNLTHPEDYVIVYTVGQKYKAEMYKANLEGADINTLILGQQDQNFPAPGDFSIIKILVKKEDAKTALQIIEDINKNNNFDKE